MSADPANPGNENEGGGVGEGGASVPAAPQQVAAEARDLGVKLTWSLNPAEQSVKQYNVYFSEQEAGPYQLIGSTEGSSFEYISVAVKGWYRVTALNDAGESPPSAGVQLK
jgi:penicillin-binding protein